PGGGWLHPGLVQQVGVEVVLLPDVVVHRDAPQLALVQVRLPGALEVDVRLDDAGLPHQVVERDDRPGGGELGGPAALVHGGDVGRVPALGRLQQRVAILRVRGDGDLDLHPRIGLLEVGHRLVEGGLDALVRLLEVPVVQRHARAAAGRRPGRRRRLGRRRGGRGGRRRGGGGRRGRCGGGRCRGRRAGGRRGRPARGGRRWRRRGTGAGRQPER